MLCSFKETIGPLVLKYFSSKTLLTKQIYLKGFTEIENGNFCSKNQFFKKSKITSKIFFENMYFAKIKCIIIFFKILKCFSKPRKSVKPEIAKCMNPCPTLQNTFLYQPENFKSSVYVLVSNIFKFQKELYGGYLNISCL